MIRRARREVPGSAGVIRSPVIGRSQLSTSGSTGPGDRGRSTRADHLAKSRHQMLPASWRHSPTANSIRRRGPGQQPEVITDQPTTAITSHSSCNEPACPLRAPGQASHVMNGYASPNERHHDNRGDSAFLQDVVAAAQAGTCLSSSSPGQHCHPGRRPRPQPARPRPSSVG